CALEFWPVMAKPAAGMNRETVTEAPLHRDPLRQLARVHGEQRECLHLPRSTIDGNDRRVRIERPCRLEILLQAPRITADDDRPGMLERIGRDRSPAPPVTHNRQSPYVTVAA